MNNGLLIVSMVTLGSVFFAGCKDGLSQFECQRGMYTLEQQNQLLDPKLPEFASGSDYIRVRPAQNPALYYVVLEIGQPAQKLRLVADTGSSDLVVPGDKSLCTNCDAETTYTPGPDAKDLDKRTLVIEYGSGKGTMDAYSDQVKLACSEEVAHEIPFAVMTKAEGLKDGILGLAYPSLSKIPLSPKRVFLDELVKNNQGKLDPIIAMTLCGDRPGSNIFLGNYDNRVDLKSVKWTPIVEESHYVVNAKKLLVSGWTNTSGAWAQATSGVKGELGSFVGFDDKSNAGIRTIVDSGTTMLYFSPSVVRNARELMRAVNRVMGANIPDGFWDAKIGSDSYALDIGEGTISKFPTLVVTLTGSDGQNIELEMTPSTYFKAWDNNKRVFSFREMSGQDNSQILGQVFMENHHVIFNQKAKKIGFASNQGICQDK